MFDNVLADIEEIFGSADWIAEDIKAVPDNYHGELGSISEYVRVMVMPSNSNLIAHGVKKNLNGLVGVKIFVPSGQGQKRLMEVADILDNYLQFKILTNGTRLDSSYINVEGLDSQNESLYSGSYFIPFTLYGE